MNRSDIGFWLLVIGVASLLIQWGWKAHQRGAIMSPDANENALAVNVGVTALGVILLWPKIQ